MSSRSAGWAVALLAVTVIALPLAGGCGGQDALEGTSGGEPAAEAPANAEPDAEQPAAGDEPGSVGGQVRAALSRVGIFLAKLVFVLVLPVAIAGTLLGMPGSALVLADAIAYSACHDWASPPWWVLIVLLLIAVGAELAESALSYLGVKQAGASNSTGVWTLVGGFTGAVVGGVLAPLLGAVGSVGGPIGWVALTVLSPIGFGMLGGFLGGYLFEVYRGKPPREARQAGWGALAGRLAGSFAKAMLVAVMAAIVLVGSWGTLF